MTCRQPLPAVAGVHTVSPSRTRAGSSRARTAASRSRHLPQCTGPAQRRRAAGAHSTTGTAWKRGCASARPRGPCRWPPRSRTKGKRYVRPTNC